MGQTDSCLITKLSHYVDLSDHSRELLSELEKEERAVARHEEVYSVAEKSRFMYVVKSGWLYSYIDLADGRRQIVKIHHPGDIVGLPDLAFEGPTSNLRACEPAVLCPFPKQGLNAILTSAPQLSALLFTLSVRDNVVLVDNMTALGRMSARERIAWFLLDLISRLRITNRNVTDALRLPLTQTEIGDMLGLTNVYVSKSFSSLERDGVLERTVDGVRLLREQDLADMVDFKNRYADMDTSWFPC